MLVARKMRQRENTFMEIAMTFLEFLSSLSDLWEALLKIFLAMIAGGITGMERGRQGRAAGMRTHILVSIGATLTSMTGMYAAEILKLGNDPLRLAAQVISGIGFLGVGTILIKGRFQITGLTTAAGLWAAGAIGIALGVGYYEGAAVTFLASVLTVTLLHRFEYKITKRNTRFGIYVEIRSDADVKTTIKHLTENFDVTDIQVTAPRSGTSGNVGIEANVHAYKLKITPERMAEELEVLPQVIFAIESI